MENQKKDSQKIVENVPKAIMVQEGTQTEIKLEEKEVQTLGVRQHDKLTQVKNESRDQHIQT